jgi:LmbE family N-acetylglucosaminyl deacetylase
VTKSLTAVFAHPDDESVTTGATLARYADEGVRTSVVLATKGEVGEIALPDLASPHNLGEVREEEARRACEILEVGALHFLGYRDGDVPKADPAEATARILDVFAAERPDVVITFGPEGIGGHPDHITVGELTTEAFHRYRDARPDARLYYAAIPRELVREGMAAMEAQGVEPFEMDFDSFGTPMAEITSKVDTTGYGARKVEALLAHATQMSNSPFAKAPREMLEGFFSTEFFVRVWPPLAAGDDLEEGLFG